VKRTSGRGKRISEHGKEATLEVVGVLGDAVDCGQPLPFVHQLTYGPLTTMSRKTIQRESPVRFPVGRRFGMLVLCASPEILRKLLDIDFVGDAAASCPVLCHRTTAATNSFACLTISHLSALTCTGR
jgi:hypothetical protein